MKLMFIGNQQDERDGSGGVVFYGVRFPLNKPVDISKLSPMQRSKLAANNHFQVVEEAPVEAAPAPAAAPVAAPSAPRASPSAPAAVEEPAAVAAPAAAPPPAAATEPARPPRIVKARGATAGPA